MILLNISSLLVFLHPSPNSHFRRLSTISNSHSWCLPIVHIIICFLPKGQTIYRQTSYRTNSLHAFLSYASLFIFWYLISMSSIIWSFLPPLFLFPLAALPMFLPSDYLVFVAYSAPKVVQQSLFLSCSSYNLLFLLKASLVKAKSQFPRSQSVLYYSSYL